MKTVQQHYEEHLGLVYSWMRGGIESALARVASEIEAPCLSPGGSGIAVDLDAGFGMNAIALAKRGFDLLAIPGLFACAVR